MKKANIFTRDILHRIGGLYQRPPPKPIPNNGFPKNIPQEVKKDTIKKKLENYQKMESLVEKSKHVLFRTSTVFPFDFFPKTVIIEEHKVDVITPIIFYSRDISSILIDYITNVSVTTSIFFASLHFEVWGMDENPPTMRYFRKSEALRARRIIQGLIACKKAEISVSELASERELRYKLEEIGTARE